MRKLRARRRASKCDPRLAAMRAAGTRAADRSPSADDAERRERRLSKTSDNSKEHLDRQDSRTTSLSSPKVSRKYFTNWKQACDKTKDKTRELLKRWRTLPEAGGGEGAGEEPMQPSGESEQHHGWSVHVWSEYQRQWRYLESRNENGPIL
ncbi:hypothetical protein EVAR_45438_1 [Eumeta japonica]|uniref:Uncharacterized protein n=1 Tax=Eumeta variegata TaxID=151549 RepID=A0A4C1YKR7_EUMVA|nr:hypothetical protein EVAR_45438_1 [Eumeta japonica]